MWIKWNSLVYRKQTSVYTQINLISRSACRNLEMARLHDKVICPDSERIRLCHYSNIDEFDEHLVHNLVTLTNNDRLQGFPFFKYWVTASSIIFQLIFAVMYRSAIWSSIEKKEGKRKKMCSPSKGRIPIRKNRWYYFLKKDLYFK